MYGSRLLLCAHVRTWGRAFYQRLFCLFLFCGCIAVKKKVTDSVSRIMEKNKASKYRTWIMKIQHFSLVSPVSKNRLLSHC